MDNPIPEQVASKILAFLRDAKTGSVTLEILNGRICSWKILEAGRIDKDAGKA